MPSTIVAPATAQGQAAVAVCRISGPDALPVLKAVLKTSKKPWKPYQMRLGTLLLDGKPTDQVLAVWMRAPHSFTGEDCAEIHTHGGSACIAAAVNACLRAGASLAEPGEFSKRAFLNGKMDLSQAEAVMDLVSATSEKAAQAALRTLSGSLHTKIEALQSALLDAAARIEAFLDYPDDDLSPVTCEDAGNELRPLRRELHTLLQNAASARQRASGPLVAIIGLPNAGKSSLLNALVGEEKAIVTEEPGTTRDLIEVPVLWDGEPFRLLDTAGLRTAETKAEQIGVKRARDAAGSAELLLVVFDGSLPAGSQSEALRFAAEPNAIAVVTKTDLPSAGETERWQSLLQIPVFPVSSATGQGLDALRETLLRRARNALTDDAYLLQQRPLAALQEAADALDRAVCSLQTLSLDCAALDIRDSWAALGRITGQTAPDALIDRVFSRFCLGK